MGKELMISMPPEAEMEANLENYRKVGLESLAKFLWVISSTELVEEIRVRNQGSRSAKPRSDYSAISMRTVAECYGVSSLGLTAEDFTSSRLFHDICKDRFLAEFKKEGYTPNTARDPALRAIFRFILPILTPDKSKRITGKLAAMIITAYEKGKPVNWASLMWDSFQLRCKRVKAGMDFFVAPMIFHLYKFEGKLSEKELLVYEEAVANRSLLEDDTSAAEGSETEDDSPIEVAPADRSETPTITKRVLRKRIKSGRALTQAVLTKKTGGEGSFINLESDDESCPVEGKLRGVLDEFCKANATNANLVEELTQKFSCSGEDLLGQIESLTTSNAAAEQERRVMEQEKKELEKKLKDSILGAVLPTLQKMTDTLLRAAEAISLSSVERLQLTALNSEGWQNDEKNLTRIATAITNQKGLLDKKYESILKAVGDLRNIMEKHVKSSPAISEALTEKSAAKLLPIQNRPAPSVEVERLEHFAKQLLEFVVPSVDFLNYYHFKKVMIRHHHGLPAFDPKRGVPLRQVYSVWEHATPDIREFLAFALLYGDLKVEDLSLANRLLGNLPGWATQFQCTYLHQLTDHLSNLIAGDIEINTHPPMFFLPDAAEVDLHSVAQQRKADILLESTAILDTLKSHLEQFQNQPLPTIFDRIQQIGGESGFSLEKLERAIVAAARVQKLFQEGADFILGEELCQFACPTTMSDREYTFISTLVEQNQLFDPLLITPDYSPPRLTDALQFFKPDEPIATTPSGKLVELPADDEVEAVQVNSDLVKEEGLSTDINSVDNADQSAEPARQKRKKPKLHSSGADSKRAKRKGLK